MCVIMVLNTDVCACVWLQSAWDRADYCYTDWSTSQQLVLSPDYSTCYQC